MLLHINSIRGRIQHDMHGSDGFEAELFLPWFEHVRLWGSWNVTILGTLVFMAAQPFCSNAQNGIVQHSFTIRLALSPLSYSFMQSASNERNFRAVNYLLAFLFVPE